MSTVKAMLGYCLFPFMLIAVLCAALYEAGAEEWSDFAAMWRGEGGDDE